MDEKDIYTRYLRATREALIWKTEGLSEREVRLPRTPTGTSLLGLVKHCASVEAEYFGPCLGREHGIPMPAYDDTDPNSDLYAAASESAIDGAAGLRASNTNMGEPDGGWLAHVAKVQAIADGFS